MKVGVGLALEWRSWITVGCYRFDIGLTALRDGALQAQFGPTLRGVSSMAELQSSKLRTMGSIPSRRSNLFLNRSLQALTAESACASVHVVSGHCRNACQGPLRFVLSRAFPEVRLSFLSSACRFSLPSRIDNGPARDRAEMDASAVTTRICVIDAP